MCLLAKSVITNINSPLHLPQLIDNEKNSGLLNDIKVEIIREFSQINFDKKSKISKCIEEITKSPNVNDVIDNVNAYLDKSKGTDRNKEFIDDLSALIRDENSVIGKEYHLITQSKKCYKLVHKHFSDSEAALTPSAVEQGVRQHETKIKAQILEGLGTEKEKETIINKTMETIKNADNELIALKDLHRITYRLVAMFNQVFSRDNKVVDDEKCENIEPQTNMSSYDLKSLEDHANKQKNNIEIYYHAIEVNLNSLPTSIDELKHLTNKEIPDVLKMIITARSELLCPLENIWTRLANAISAFLFPAISKEKQDKKMQLENNLSELDQLITELSKKPNYDNVMKSPWLYELVSHLLVQGTPVQYPFDPFNVLSPDRKVWLELQKEWLTLLQDKSVEPELSQ
ncbi:hypothetical protein [Yersinia vastinensis]|uniref:hypothetical protein n=1 Tax=Yersinia vastinensis TaxID=2890318 RepID=UPI0005E96128|nr:hypothetical protein [Yersinia vastinensis]OVZ98403.1 hypothetical protein CBW53_05635 [Yersinia frederiksenii]CNI26508.1 Uncharacterised protein [Yersinia frederiksenii]